MARPRTDIAPRILAAARRRFRQSGVEGASLRAIARDARTSIGMIYYYYPTKDELFFAVVEATYAKLMADLERVLAPEIPVAERLTHLFERLAALSDEEVEILRLVVLEGLMSSPRFERIVTRFMRGHIALGLKTVLDGLGDGTLDRRRHPIVLLLSMFTLAGPPQLISRVVGERLPVPGAPKGQALARELVDVLLHGIAAQTAPPNPTGGRATD